MTASSSKIFTRVGTNRCVGRLSFIVESSRGDLLGVTARDVLQSNEVFLRDTGEEVIVGQRLNRFCRDRKLSPAPDQQFQSVELFGWFSISNEFSIDKSMLVSRNKYSNVATSLGQEVSFKNGLSWGYVYSINAKVNIASPFQGGSNIFRGLIEVRIENLTGIETESSLAGEPVFANDETLLGIVVAQDDSTIFLAPVGDILDAEQFSIVDSARIDQHNSSVNLQNSITDTADQFISLIANSPDRWLKVCEETRDELSGYFSRESRLFGSRHMTEVQDHLAFSIYSHVSFDKLAEGITRIRIENDAPGRRANENWLWRSLIERLGLLSIDIDSQKVRVCSTDTFEKCMILPRNSDNIRSPLEIEEEEYSSLVSIPQEEAIDDLADVLFGTNTYQVEDA